MSNVQEICLPSGGFVSNVKVKSVNKALTSPENSFPIYVVSVR